MWLRKRCRCAQHISRRNCDIPKTDSDIGEFPFFIVTPRGYEEHETSCSLISSSRIKGTDRQSLTFSCWSEGDHPRHKEVWSITQKKADALHLRREEAAGEGVSTSGVSASAVRARDVQRKMVWVA